MLSFTEFLIEGIPHPHHLDQLATGTPGADAMKASAIEQHNKFSKMSPEKHIEKMDKTLASIRSHVSGGGQFNSPRGHELSTRFDDHHEHLIRYRHEHAKAWHKKHNFDGSSTGSDAYA